MQVELTEYDRDICVSGKEAATRLAEIIDAQIFYCASCKHLYETDVQECFLVPEIFLGHRKLTDTCTFWELKNA